ncbi:MFS transporter [Actinomadura harenae]|uniref:MFS transporter n=1 Tax=Actinomadura harenae TaxID=2483351 RepID=A0A3M2M604_9ACTN|nr:MFS transporter [Actinomadura harenae]RMI45107.1 MFS transporter [Actinomadura harenae]
MTVPAQARRWWMLTLLGAAFFMTILDGTTLLTALPAIERHLRLHGPAVQWTVTAYALAFGGLVLLCGRAADLLGRKRMFVAGMLLRVAASLACGLAPSIQVLVAARALQGVSAAIIAPAALSMVMNAFPEGGERNKALGIWGGLGGLGATAGLLLGGLITDALGWQWVFWINIPVGVLVLAFAPGLLRESRDLTGSRSFDIAGALTITPALVLLVYVITRMQTSGWASGTTVGLLAVAIVLVWVFVLVERRSAAPLVPLGTLRSRMLIGGDLLLLLAGMAVDGMLITLTSFAQQVLGWSAARFGLVAALMTVAAVIGALLSQRVVTRLGPRRVATAGTVLLGCGCLLLTRIPVGGSMIVLPIALCLFGAGMGVATVCGQIAALTGVRESDSGLAAGLADTSFAVGTALGAAICTSVATARTSATGGPAPLALTAGHHAAFATAAVFAALGLLTALGLLRQRSARPRTVATDAGESTPTREPSASP